MPTRNTSGPPDPTLYLRSLSLERDDVPSFDAYPFCLPAIRGLDRLEFRAPVTFLVGENGAGKSTLLEAIAVAWGLNAEGGSRNLNFSTRATHSPLHRLLHLVRTGNRTYDSYFLRAESFYNVATQLEALERVDRSTVRGLPLPPLEDYGGGSLHEQSHGESFFTLMTERLGGGGLYLMDEPEAALSPTRQMAALVRMRDLVRLRSQLIIATHSPILMAYPGAEILLLDENGIGSIDYEDTEHYVVTREFLNRPDAMIRELFAD
ncbi:MAG TPA: AAA family ATPase [Longimicrobiaceae bacterium]|nr:AAA family ATPase [Longimicrobiaceae bacterium]